MKKKQVLTFLLTAMVVFVVSPLAWGTAFISAPETNPNITWETQYPDYQRNIFLDFSVNPVGASGSGIPGAIYAGDDDAMLWGSDYVELSGAAVWNEDLDAVGIFDATADATGSITLYINNWDRDLPVKHIYEEFSWYTSALDGTTIQLPSHEVADGYTLGEPWFEVSGIPPLVGHHTGSYYIPVEPNPTWEKITINFIAKEGQSSYLKSMHVATECVPEPATLCLLGLGGLLLRRKKSA